MSNPGFMPVNIWIEKSDKRITRILRSNLRGVEGNKFSFLDPNFAWHPGFEYWGARFKQTIKEIYRKKKCSKYDALIWLKKRIACLQLVPYASIYNNLPYGLIKKLSSSIKAQKFAKEVLFRQAQKGQKLLVVVRKAKIWGLPEGPGVKNILRLNNRGAYLESNPEIRDQIWRILGL